MRLRDLATSRITRPIALGAGIVLLASACSGGAESGIEKLIEQQGGGDVDLDLDADGGFSIQTEEGGMSIDEDGNFVITGEDGEVITGNANGDGNFNIESDEGTITGSGEDGDFNIESDEGSFTVSSGSDMPSEWPSDVPEPENYTITTSSVIGTGDDLLIGLVGNTSQSGADFVESYGEDLVSAGFEQASSFESEGSVLRVFTNGSWNVSVGVFEGPEGEPQVTVNLVREN